MSFDWENSNWDRPESTLTGSQLSGKSDDTFNAYQQSASVGYANAMYGGIQHLEDQISPTKMVTTMQPNPNYQGHQEQEYEVDESQYFQIPSDPENLIQEAELRFEQGQLYRMLLKHNFFEGIEANEQAVQNVENELKNFVMVRLEVLLGMRRDNSRSQQQEAPSQFNDVEVMVLKQLAHKMSSGLSSKPEANTSKVPTLQVKAAKTVLNKLSAAPKIAPQPLVKKPVAKPVPQPQFQAPQQKPVRKQAVPTKQKYKKKELDKPIDELSEAELQERALEIQKEQKALKAEPERKIPMPSVEQFNLIQTSRAGEMKNSGTKALQEWANKAGK